MHGRLNLVFSEEKFHGRAGTRAAFAVDKRLIGELLRIQALFARQGVVGRGDHAVGVAGKGLGHHRGAGRWAAHDGQVNLTGFQLCDHGLAVGDAHIQFNVRVLGMKLRDQARCEIAGGGDEGNFDFALVTALQGVERVTGITQALGNPLGIGQQGLARTAEHQVAAAFFKKGHAHRVRQLGHLHGHRRLGEVQRLGRPRKTRGFTGDDENLQLAQGGVAQAFGHGAFGKAATPECGVAHCRKAAHCLPRIGPPGGVRANKVLLQADRLSEPPNSSH